MYLKQENCRGKKINNKVLECLVKNGELGYFTFTK